MGERLSENAKEKKKTEKEMRARRNKDNCSGNFNSSQNTQAGGQSYRQDL